ncbi:MAG: aldose 1-epimerase [Solirubrobacteraceae bacterium]|nr:aldose 1-epimerase [Solirubrobacteraceae bacterium]
MTATPPPSTPAGAVRLVDREHDLVATFVPSAGMIGSSLLHRGEELLGQRRGFEAYRTDGKTMGIPFLHPWANRLSGRSYTAAGVTVDLPDGAPGVRLDPGGLPIHGLLAASPHWKVEPPVGADGDERPVLVASLLLADQPELLPSFPFPHEVELSVTLTGGRLTITTTVVPTSDRPVPLAFGFHPYLQLPGVPREAWQVELPAMRHRPVDERGIPTGAADPTPAETFTLADRTFDDGYDALRTGATFALEGGGRRIEVVFEEGYPAAQVFAPAEDPVICFEPMAAPTSALVSGDGLRLAEPGRPSVATFSIAVR